MMDQDDKISEPTAPTSEVAELAKALYSSVFEIRDREQKYDFIAWILNLSEDEVRSGEEFLRSHNTAFRVLGELFPDEGPYTVVLENHYVDRVYRDSFYFYYSSKHFNYNRFCKRVCLFRGSLDRPFFDATPAELEASFMGAIVIRPIPDRSIGRTLLSPRYFLPDQTGYLRLTNYSVTVYGKRLTVRAFPYSMQDGETTSCAEITILNLLDFYSQSYPEYHYLLPSEISNILESSSYERRIPTTGLSYELISKVFCVAGFYPRLYSTIKMNKRKFRHILYYYIESGIPVALGLKLSTENKHSVVVIGHSANNTQAMFSSLSCACDSHGNTPPNPIWICDTADTVDHYCVMDDNAAPYEICECAEKPVGEAPSVPSLQLKGRTVEYIMVPLYKRMIMEAADAYDICMSIVASEKFSLRRFLSDDAISGFLTPYDKDAVGCGSRDNPVVVRLFMASSRSLKMRRDENFLQEKNYGLRNLYDTTVFPKFVWVCELTTRNLYEAAGPKRIIGEIIIDATSSATAKTDSFIIVHYPGLVCRRMPEDFTSRTDPKFLKIRDWHPSRAFYGNLDKVQPRSDF